jgi:hypothetical protein
MRRHSGRGIWRSAERHESHFGKGGTAADLLAVSRRGLGPHGPRHDPYLDEAEEALHGPPLGTPLTIEDVADLLGCSPWTVRQKYLPQGLPHLRASASGKLVFFRARSSVGFWNDSNNHMKGGT